MRIIRSTQEIHVMQCNSGRVELIMGLGTPTEQTISVNVEDVPRLTQAMTECARCIIADAVFEG